MVVTEREPSPQQGQSPNLSEANIKDGIETGLSPVPPSHSSTEDRSSSGLGNCTDQELSDCPITPLTPPASLTFLQPFPSECETPAATTPFPKCSEEEEGYEDEAYQSVPENEQDESKKPVSSFEEQSTGIENVLEHLEEGEIDGEGEMDSATLVEDQQMKDIEKCQEEKQLEKCMEEVSEHESTEQTETRLEETEKSLEFSAESDKCSERLEQTEPKMEESDKCSESLEHTENEMEETESVIKSEQTAEEETKFEDTSEQKETKFEERMSEQSITEGSECRESYEQKETVVEQVCSTKVSEQSVSVEKVKVEEISVNQLWNLWSSSAPKVTEETKEEQRIEESPSAGQIGEEKMEENEKEELKEQSEIVEKQETVDDLNDTRMKLGDAERRLHEMEVEIKRLENEREELNSAYREAEALRKQEEAKAQRLTAELTQVRHEYEKRLIAKEEEIESLRKQMQIEIEQLSQRVAEAEAKVKTEVARIKKKMQVQITELEMSLDVANKQNIDLQKTIKKQSLQITELQAHYDEIHRQLQQTVDQLGVSQRRCQALQAELEETRVNLEQALRAKRITEQQVEEATSRINELNTLNVNLTSAKSKLEAEFMSLQSDYEEINKELRISDERYNRVQIELKSTKDVLIEEQERLVKIESIKKSLEIEVHNLTVRIEEVEANALAGGKRVISKLESRIRDVEIELEEEKRRHVETQKVLRKKEHRIKELIVQAEEDHQTLVILNDSVDKLSEKCKMYKRQLAEQEGMSQQNLTRVRRFQRELEAAEERADQAESNLNLIRAKHRSWVTTSQIPGGLKQVIVTEETSSTTSQY